MQISQIKCHNFWNSQFKSQHLQLRFYTCAATIKHFPEPISLGVLWIHRFVVLNKKQQHQQTLNLEHFRIHVSILVCLNVESILDVLNVLSVVQDSHSALYFFMPT